MKSQQISNFFYMTLSAGLLSTSAGCGGGVDEGPQRYQVSGKVTYDNQPLPYGLIVFNPDGSKDNSGPQGIATIKDGVYDTSKGDEKGVVGGPMIIDIMGATSSDITEGGTGKILFNSYTQKEDLPKDTSTLDITIPKDAGSPKSSK